MRYLSLGQLLRIHDSLLESSGGAAGIRDLGRVEAALAQPMARFGGHDLYATLVEKAAALAFSIIQGHPFIDGNKRAGHAAMAVFLRLFSPNSLSQYAAASFASSACSGCFIRIFISFFSLTRLPMLIS